jgi:pimeloyl-ACP methyl ester carboxylesterase
MKFVIYTLAITSLTPAAFAQSSTFETPEMLALTTGSEVASWTTPANGPAKKTPVLYLHGGPGMYTEARRIEEGAVLRANGFTTLYFDQAGGGKSKRLPASQYTLARAVADVEAYRVARKADRVILWGNSYGATLAMLYAKAHPDRVAGLILTSPGGFPGTDFKRNYGLTNRGKLNISKELSAATSQIDKRGALAEDKVSQEASGKMFDQLAANDMMQAMVCKNSAMQSAPISGGGNLFVNRMLQKELDKLKFEITAPKVPAIILRGSCDFIPDENAQHYKSALNAELVTLPNVGHGLLEDRAAVNAALDRFAKTTLATIE